MSFSYGREFICQHLHPTTANFTDDDLPPQKGRIIIVTGASSGIGAELARMLYAKHATVYLAARSQEKLQKAKAAIEGAVPQSEGRLEILVLDLGDLAGIKRSAEDFLTCEKSLHVLIHNAGVMMPASGSKTKDGYDLEMGTNCLGPWLFNHHLLELMKKTTAHCLAAGCSPEVASGRIIFAASSAILTAREGGVVYDETTGAPSVLSKPMDNYSQSKAGNVFLAVEVARRYGADGIISVSIDPGFVKSELQREWSALQRTISFATGWWKEVKYGAFVELFAAFSPKVTKEQNGGIVVPWGQIGHFPTGIAKALATGGAERFWKWCERETKAFH
jgi:retinol dehydrogenase 12